MNEHPEMAKLIPNRELCCSWLNLDKNCICPDSFSIEKEFFTFIMKTVVQVLKRNSYPSTLVTCEGAPIVMADASSWYPEILTEISKNKNVKQKDKHYFEYHVQISIHVARNDNLAENVLAARYYNNEIFLIDDARPLKSVKRFLRIGTVPAIPWVYYKVDPETREKILDKNNKTILEGYCIDLIRRLAEAMEFDYEILLPETGTYGKRVNGRWDGIIGDLVRGRIDISVASLKMTAEREEAIDFIAPYFEQTGISIIMRKPVRETSLFKFMTVLRLEVWLSIVGALVATAIMIWILDRFSPYSARNNPDAYPYPCREFTLKESFWFALTSFTPQGGGEAPKAISGRTLVAAYWLFVVLMLATFTANLAAFLTVERMQTPVQSLEQLARQSRINYTVLQKSDTYNYFHNMKKAEETLFKTWKEITLNSSNDNPEYRVWDYPIKEQYSHILTSIEQSGLLKSAEEGFTKVNDLIAADFAFIHDSAEIKYMISRNCNFTEVGEVFAEQPYALAVQQGSHLQDELSRTILLLQKERYFESLTAKYWNHSIRGECPNADDSEGITLQSLGGVFIATLFGLALAMITLIGEVFYFRKKEEESKIINVEPIDEKYSGNTKNLTKNNKGSKIPDNITFGKKFVPAVDKTKPVSYISVFPRNAIHSHEHFSVD